MKEKESSMPLQGKKALIIGGSGGIGRACSKSVARAGAHCIIHGSGESDNLISLETELLAEGLSVELFACKVDPIDRFIAKARRLLPVDILICAYGPFLYKGLTETSPEDWSKLALHDFALPGSLVSLALKDMVERHFGRIVLFGGTKTETIRGFRMNAAYAASKTALGVIARSVSESYAPYNISCTVICPGFVDTEYVDIAEKKRLALLTPSGKLGEPEDVAKIVLQIVSDTQMLFNGAIIPLDGGIST